MDRRRPSVMKLAAWSCVAITCLDVARAALCAFPERYPGYDVQPGTQLGASTGVLSEGDCLDLCLLDSRCNTAVYSLNGYCFQKSGTVQDIVGEGLLTSLIVLACPAPTQALCTTPRRLPGFDVNPGVDIGYTIDVQGEIQCLNTCVQSPGCVSAVYTDNGYCFRKSVGAAAAVGAGQLSNLVLLWCGDVPPGPSPPGPSPPAPTPPAPSPPPPGPAPGAECTYHADCSENSAGIFCHKGVCGGQPKCQSIGTRSDYHTGEDGQDLAALSGLTPEECRNRCWFSIFCEAANYTRSGNCYLKVAGQASAVPREGNDVLYCLDPKPLGTHVPETRECSADSECAAPGRCVDGLCKATYTGECLDLATEQIVSPGGATNSPINNGLKQVVFDYDQTKETFCPLEIAGDEITVTGQVIVRRVDDAGEVTCELCPEAECYMWIPNLNGRYVAECSGKMKLNEYGEFKFVSNEPGCERCQGQGPDPYGHWHYDCHGCGGRHYNKIYRQLPDYVGEDKAALEAALGYPEIRNEFTPVTPGGRTEYTYTIVLEEGTFTVPRLK